MVSSRPLWRCRQTRMSMRATPPASIGSCHLQEKFRHFRMADVANPQLLAPTGRELAGDVQINAGRNHNPLCFVTYGTAFLKMTQYKREAAIPCKSNSLALGSYGFALTASGDNAGEQSVTAAPRRPGVGSHGTDVPQVPSISSEAARSLLPEPSRRANDAQTLTPPWEK